MGLHVSGGVTGGTVVVVPEDQLDAAAALAAHLLADDPAEESGLWEWSTAIVREPGRSRLAVRVDHPRTERAESWARTAFATAVGAEWFITIRPGHDRLNLGDRIVATPDRCTVRNASGTVVADTDNGLVYLENEPVPARLVELGDRYGDGQRALGRMSAGIIVANNSHRPLEPDEETVE